jgi:hypothetical protein
MHLYAVCCYMKFQFENDDYMYGYFQRFEEAVEYIKKVAVQCNYKDGDHYGGMQLVKITFKDGLATTETVELMIDVPTNNIDHVDKIADSFTEVCDFPPCESIWSWNGFEEEEQLTIYKPLDTAIYKDYGEAMCISFDSKKGMYGSKFCLLRE